MIMGKFKFILLFLVLISSSFAAGNKISVEDFLQFKYPQNLAVHPDGNHFAFIVRVADFQKNIWQQQLWYLDLQEKAPRRFTFSRGDDTNPQWSPDGSWLTFVSDRQSSVPSESKNVAGEQIWAIPATGGEAQPWTSLSRDVEEYRWSEDGKFLFILTMAEKPADVVAREQMRKKFGFDEMVKDSIREDKWLWKFEVATGKTSKIAILDPGAEQFSLSHDGQWIVYQTNYTGAFDDAQKYDLWGVNTESGKKFQLTAFAGPETQPQFSPDDRWISYVSQTTPDVEFAETDLSMIRFEPGKMSPDTVNLTRHFNLSVIDYQWEAGRKTVLMRIARGTETPLYRLNPKRKTRPQMVAALPGNVLEVSIHGKTVYYLWEDFTHLPEIVRLQKGKSEVLTSFSRPLRQFDWGTQKIYRWQSIDGQQIEGLLFLPPDFSPEKKYPLILAVHGGPYGRVRQAVRQSHYKQIYASTGYVVLAPNPRGSSGYDDNFGKAIWYQHGGNMGGIDYHDVMSGVDALIGEGYIDPERMGVIGGSYGGYLTNWIISQTDRFAAAVSQFGLFSFFTDWANSWQPAFEKMYFGIFYWERPIDQNHPYVKYSPAFYVKNITTPVLILHGEKDRYTNLANSQEMYQALHSLGREVKFVVYPRERHGIGEEPNHRRDAVHRSQKWFDTHLR